MSNLTSMLPDRTSSPRDNLTVMSDRSSSPHDGSSLTSMLPERISPREDAIHSKPLFDKIYEKIKNDLANEWPAPPPTPNAVNYTRLPGADVVDGRLLDVSSANTVSRATISTAPVANHPKLNNLRANHRFDRISNLAPMVPKNRDETPERRKIIDINLCSLWEQAMETTPCFPCFPERVCSSAASPATNNLDLPTPKAVFENIYNISHR